MTDHLRWRDRSAGGNGSEQTSCKIGEDKTQSSGMRRQRKHEEQSTPWGAMLEVEPYEAEVGPTNPVAVTLVIHKQTVFGQVQLVAVWNW